MHGPVGVDLMDDATPLAAQPNSVGPPRVQDDVHVLGRSVPPVEGLAELQRLLAYPTSEKTLVGRLAVDSHHVLGDDVANVLHQPREDGVVGWELGAEIACQVHAQETFEDLHRAFDTSVRGAFADGCRKRRGAVRQSGYDGVA